MLSPSKVDSLIKMFPELFSGSLFDFCLQTKKEIHFIVSVSCSIFSFGYFWDVAIVVACPGMTKYV